jgi:hypothetical protein
VPCQALNYLGMRVEMTGRIGVGGAKATRLLRDVTLRLERARRLCGDADLDTRAKLLCGIVNAALDPLHPTAERAALLLRHVVNDREQLEALDFQLALRVAERLSGQRGVRAFRAMPIRTLRERHGLASLVAQRNRQEHGARAVRRP